MKILFILLLSLSSFSLFASEITVLAASSLTNVLSDLGKKFEKEKGTKVKFQFDSSARLAQQIHEGAKADLFFSADKEWNKYLENKKNVISGNTKELLSNELVLISHKSNKTAITDLKTLLRISFKTICVANETVPAGKYAHEAMKKADVLEQVRGKTVSGDNVRNVLAWVAKNEADYGIVFATDAKVEPKVVVKYKIPSEMHSEINYPVSLIGEAPSQDAKNFYDYLQTPAARKAFEKSGFKWK